MNCTSFKTLGFQGYAVKFSPFDPSLLAAATCSNFGLAGHSALFILKKQDDEIQSPQFSLANRKFKIMKDRVLDYNQDGIFDLTWSENDPRVIWVAGANGKILIYNLSNQEQNQPMLTYEAHSKEISSIEWSQNKLNGPLIITASWDSHIKIWDGINCKLIKSYFGANFGNVYCASFSPLATGILGCACASGEIIIYDLKSDNVPILKIPASKSELLSIDFNKYNQNMLAVSSADGLVLIYDVRNINLPISILSGHDRAIKKIKFSPFQESVLASVSYDFTTRIWDLSMKPNPIMLTMANHSEFVYGLDWNLHIKDELVDCSWDQNIVISSPAKAL